MSEHTPTPYLIGKPDREWNEFIKICNEISADQIHHEARVITFGSDPNDPNYRIICLLGPGPHAHDNAEFIVEACNSHAKLIAQNKRIRTILESALAASKSHVFIKDAHNVLKLGVEQALNESE